MTEIVREDKVMLEDYISTGLTELDLNISGSVTRYGGIKAGSMVEIVGWSGLGKTGLLMEIVASILYREGRVNVNDAENRLNAQYVGYFGIDINDINKTVPKTVTDMQTSVDEFFKKNEEDGFDGWQISGTDSVAALCSQEELDGNDPYGGTAAAKQLNKACRMLTKDLSGHKRILVWINQLRDNLDPMARGKPRKTGGHGLDYYTDLRLIVGKGAPYKVEKKVKLENGREVSKYIGINTTVEIDKSSIDVPFAKCNAPIIWRYGMDDIQNNLKYLKDNRKDTKFGVGIDGFDGYVSMSKTLGFLDENPERALMLREATVDLWHEIDEKFKQNRRPKGRF